MGNDELTWMQYDQTKICLLSLNKIEVNGVETDLLEKEYD